MNKSSGQVAVFVLLIMLLGLTVGLSVTSRTLQDLKQSSVSDQSSRAFSAAEAGVEYALQIGASTLVGSSPATTTVGGSQVVYSVADAPPGAFTSDGQVPKDETISVDLTGGTSANVCWMKTGEAEASLEITVYNSDNTATKYAVNRNGFVNGNNFLQSNGIPPDSGYQSCENNIALAANAKVMRIRPVYNPTTVKITGANLPSQAYVVTSTAKTADQTTRAVQVTQSKGGLPSIFDYTLFSGNVGSGIVQ